MIIYNDKIVYGILEKIFVLKRNWLKENNKIGIKQSKTVFFKKREENKYQTHTCTEMRTNLKGKY